MKQMKQTRTKKQINADIQRVLTEIKTKENKYNIEDAEQVTWSDYPNLYKVQSEFEKLFNKLADLDNEYYEVS